MEIESESEGITSEVEEEGAQGSDGSFYNPATDEEAKEPDSDGEGSGDDGGSPDEALSGVESEGGDDFFDDTTGAPLPMLGGMDDGEGGFHGEGEDAGFASEEGDEAKDDDGVDYGDDEEPAPAGEAAAAAAAAGYEDEDDYEDSERENDDSGDAYGGDEPAEQDIDTYADPELGPSLRQGRRNFGGGSEGGSTSAAVQKQPRRGGSGGGARSKCSKEAEALVGQSHRAYTDGNQEEAIRFANQAIKVDPRAVAAYSFLAELAEESGQVGQVAQLLYLKASVANKDADQYLEAADAAQRAGKLDLALLCTTRAVKLKPNSLGPLANRAELLADMGKTRQAMEAYRALLQRHPHRYNFYGDLISICPKTPYGHAFAIAAMTACLGCAMGRNALKKGLLDLLENVPQSYGARRNKKKKAINGGEEAPEDSNQAGADTGPAGSQAQGANPDTGEEENEPAAPARENSSGGWNVPAKDTVDSPEAVVAIPSAEEAESDRQQGWGEPICALDAVNSAAEILVERLVEHGRQWAMAAEALDSVDRWLRRLRSKAPPHLQARFYLNASLALQQGLCLAHLGRKEPAKAQFQSLMELVRQRGSQQLQDNNGEDDDPSGVSGMILQAAECWLEVGELHEAETLAQALVAAEQLPDSYSGTRGPPRRWVAARLLLARVQARRGKYFAAAAVAAGVLDESRHSVAACVAYAHASRMAGPEKSSAALGTVTRLAKLVIQEEASGGRADRSSGGGSGAGGGGSGAGGGGGGVDSSCTGNAGNDDTEAGWDRVKLLLEWAALGRAAAPRNDSAAAADFVSVAAPLVEAILRPKRAVARAAAGAAAAISEEAAAAVAAAAAAASTTTAMAASAAPEAAPVGFRVIREPSQWEFTSAARDMATAAMAALASRLDLAKRIKQEPTLLDVFVDLTDALLGCSQVIDSQRLASEGFKHKRLLSPAQRQQLRAYGSGYGKSGGDGGGSRRKCQAGQYGFSGDGDQIFTPAERETLAAVVAEGGQKGDAAEVLLWNAVGRILARNGVINCTNSPVFQKLLRRMHRTAPSCLLSGHVSVDKMRLRAALQRYVEATDMWPREPLPALVLATALLRLVGQRRTADPHGIVLRAAACLQLYGRLRREAAARARVAGGSSGGIGRGSGPTEAAVEQEVWFNTGRAFHHIGLANLAVEYYNRALRIHDERTAELSGDAAEHMSEDSAENTTGSVTLDAAHNLMALYRDAGSITMARAIMMRYLVIG